MNRVIAALAGTSCSCHLQPSRGKPGPGSGKAGETEAVTIEASISQHCSIELHPFVSVLRSWLRAGRRLAEEPIAASAAAHITETFSWGRSPCGLPEASNMKLATVDQYLGTLPRPSISLCFNGLDLVFDEAILQL